MNDLSDADLVRCIQNSSVAPVDSRMAIAILYDNHHERIFRYLWMRVGDRQQAEDLTGEVFARMVAKLPGYQNNGLPFEAWLYRIARNLLVDQYRRQNKVKWVQLEEASHLAVEEQDPSASPESRAIFAEIRQALERIDPQQREVVIMRFLLGLPIKEVALIMERSIPTIKALQFRGLRGLRSILETA